MLPEAQELSNLFTQIQHITKDMKDGTQNTEAGILNKNSKCHRTFKHRS